MRIRRHPHLLEIPAWPWLERLSRQSGRLVTLGDVPDAVWDACAAQGFDLIYLMGVWQRSRLGRTFAQSDPELRAEYERVLPGWTTDDVPGSPYCISAYVPDERMGGWDGLDAARQALQARGLRLMIDFVSNHTAFDHPWIESHPDRYVLGSDDDRRLRPDDFREAGGALVACGRDPYFPPWRDVAQLNYCNPETRAAMIGVLRTMAAHADAVRCDMAMLVLNDVFERTWRHVLRDEWPAPVPEFWPAATAEVPSLLYLAESYWDLEWTLQQQGFDFTYDKRLLDRLHGAPATDVRAHLLADAAFTARLARFLENHDEPRSASQFGARVPAAATALATLPGMRFFFEGQIEGARLRAPVQLARWPDEPVDAGIHDLYTRLLAAADQDLFHDGDWDLLPVTTAGNETYADLIAWGWRWRGQLAVVVVNLGSRASHGHVPLRDLPDGESWTFEDRLTGAAYRWDRADLERPGLYVRLEAGRAHVLIAEA
ncbi:MAG: alpha-amylase family glycosyl hydrolase [Vicinamibacterales bacterium]